MIRVASWKFGVAILTTYNLPAGERDEKTVLVNLLVMFFCCQCCLQHNHGSALANTQYLQYTRTLKRKRKGAVEQCMKAEDIEKQAKQQKQREKPQPTPPTKPVRPCSP
jgi:hypothetical protein